MRIENDIIYENHSYHVVYQDCDSFDDLPREKIRQHSGVCFVAGKIVVCWNGKKQTWSLPGGTVEPGENFDDTLIREIREESNMRVLSHIPIGYQEIFSDDGTSILQLRSYCIVEPYGEFLSDPAGSVTKIAFIDSEEWGKYIDWGKIGEHILERAMKRNKK